MRHLSAIISVISIFLIILYSAYTINEVLASNSSHTVVFTLGSVYRDVTYCNSQTLDLYVPNSAVARPLPLAIYVHGGGMTSGDKADINPIFLNALATADYAVASINYRLAPQYKYPVQIEDVKCAIRYLRATAHLYGINGSKVFAFGTSVGGQLVAIAALTGVGSPFDVGPYLNESSALTAVADMFGPANLITCGCFSDPQMQFGDNQSNMMLASPTHYIVPNSPPFLIIQGLNDTTVPYSQSTQLYDGLRAAGDQTQLVLVHNMGHMFAQTGSQPIDPSLEQIAHGMISFFGKYKVST